MNLKRLYITSYNNSNMILDSITLAGCCWMTTRNYNFVNPRQIHYLSFDAHHVVDSIRLVCS